MLRPEHARVQPQHHEEGFAPTEGGWQTLLQQSLKETLHHLNELLEARLDTRNHGRNRTNTRAWALEVASAEMEEAGARMMSYTRPTDNQRTYNCFWYMNPTWVQKKRAWPLLYVVQQKLTSTACSSPFVCFAFLHAFRSMLPSMLAGMFMGHLVGKVKRLPVGMNCRTM